MWSSLIIGIFTVIGCNFAVDVQYILKIDDGFVVWALHGVGSYIGAVLTSIFAADYVNATGSYYIVPIKRG